MQPDERLTVTVEEAGKLLGVSRGLAYELVARGDLPSLRLGRRRVVPRVAIDTMIADACTKEGDKSEPPDPGPQLPRRRRLQLLTDEAERSRG